MSFFTSLSLMSPDEAAEACRVEQDRAKAEVERLLHARQMTARGDKAGAHRLLSEIAAANAVLKRVKDLGKTYRLKAETQETHSLWKSAVRAVAGDDALRACYDWMKQERVRRDTQRCEGERP